jgi:hypothetical protein
MLPARVLTLIALTTFVGGCAHYEYDIVEPSDLSQRIGTKSALSIPMEPIHYEAISSNDRLVIQIHNETDEPIKLLGEDSFAVDPHGQSHPLPTQTIAPGASARLILPPVRPTFQQSGPSVGVGVGVGVGHNYGRAGYRHGFAGDPYFYDDYPRYYAMQDDGTRYWEWTGDGTEVRVRIVYRRSDSQFHHDFVFRRVKV